MFIKKIQRMNSFGVFRAFEWGAELEEFARCNLLFGRNYSGKTTLSCAFLQLERGEPVHGLESGSFSFVDEAGNIVRSSECTSQRPGVRVFNSEYVRKNIKIDEPDGVRAFVLTGEERIEDTKALEALRQSLAQLGEDKQAIIDEQRRAKEAWDHALTSEATRVRTDFGITPFNRDHLSAVIAALQQQDSHVPSETEYEAASSIWRQSDQAEWIKPFLYQEWPKALSVTMLEARTLVERNVVARRIEGLASNPTVAEWVRAGLSLHQTDDNCKFCTQAFPAGRLDELKNHFSKDVEELIQRIDAVRSALRALRESKPQAPDSGLLFKDLRTPYLQEMEKLGGEERRIVETVELALEVLGNKRDRPFDTFDTSVFTVRAEGWESACAALSMAIETHNERVLKGKDGADQAAETIKRYFAKRIRDDANLNGHRRVIEEAQGRIAAVQSELNAVEVNVRKLEARLNSAGIGAERINALLAEYFGKRDLIMEPAEEGRFRVVRRLDGRPEARRVSEGERTAIAFCHFLASLSQNGQQLDDLLVFVDDPVSSLDSNHIYSVAGIIRGRLAGARQLFVSTHNAHLFGILRRWIAGKRDDAEERARKSGAPVAVYKHAMYHIRRETAANGEWSSKLEELPPEMKRFDNEYAWTYARLCEAREDGVQDDEMRFAMPNLLRRFVESYLAARYPDGGLPSEKLPKLFEEDRDKQLRVWAFINKHSHELGTEMSEPWPERDECVAVLEQVFDAMQKVDPEHMKSLNRALERT